ncbi:MAG: hypothetical protein HYY44_05365 [Deltaproteobacteria bacterium]|nr:hypothetical protein [Deltaproteobacteria bacterium]
MLDIRFVLDNIPKVREALARKGFPFDPSGLERLNDQRKKLQKRKKRSMT